MAQIWKFRGTPGEMITVEDAGTYLIPASGISVVGTKRDADALREAGLEEVNDEQTQASAAVAAPARPRVRRVLPGQENTVNGVNGPVVGASDGLGFVSK